MGLQKLGVFMMRQLNVCFPLGDGNYARLEWLVYLRLVVNGCLACLCTYTVSTSFKVGAARGADQLT